ncbi:PAS domain S-box protein [bacterium]|nr:PAS domain S-box protein [bacterium]
MMHKKQELQNQSTHILESIQDGVAVSDIDGVLIDVNPAFCRMTGFTRKELSGTGFPHPYWPPENADMIKNVWTASEEDNSQNIKLLLMRKNGERFSVLVSHSWIINIRSDSMCRIVVFKDYDAYKMIGLKLADVYQNRENIFQAIGQPAFILDPEYNIILINQAAIEAAGIPYKKLIGSKCYELFHRSLQPPDGCPMRQVLNSDKMESNEIEVELLGRTFLVSCTPVLDSENRLREIIHIATDITEKKKVEEKAEMLSAVVEQSEEGISIADLKGNLLFVNKAWCRMHGYKSPKNLIGKNLSIFHSEEQLKNDVEQFNRNVIELGAFRGEVGHITQDKKPFPTYMTSIVLRDRQGKVFGIAGIAKDITMQKQTEEKLRKSEAQLINAMMIANLGHWELDVIKGIFTFSDNFYAIFHTNAKEMGGYQMSIGDYAKRFVHPDDASLVGEETRMALETDDPNFNRYIEHRIIYADGGEGCIAVRFFIIKNDKGVTIKTYGVNQDITERKNAQIELAQSEARFRGLFMSMSEGFYLSEVIYDSEGNPCDYRYLEANPGFMNIVGVDRDHLIGKRYKELVPIDTTDWLDHYFHVARTGESVNYEFFSPEYNKYFMTYSYRPQEHQVSVFVLDTSKKKQAEIALKRALTEKEVLLRELYHRTKNNMQVISSMLRLKARSVKETDLAFILNEIESKISSMALVHQKLYKSKDLSHIDLKEYIDELITLIRKSYREILNNIVIRAKLETVHVLLDTAIPLGLVINELLTNSVKHAFPDNRGGEIQVQISKTSGKIIVLEIMDNGIGLPKNFDFQKDIHLGLQTVLDLAEGQLGAKVKFTSRNGLHCRMTFSRELYKPRI